MPQYYGTVTVTLHGWFKADGVEEILENPLECISSVTVETEINDIDVETEEDE